MLGFVEPRFALVPAVTGSTLASSILKQREKCLGGSLSLARKGGIVVVEEDNSPTSQTTASFERKVSRSKSIGNESRNFSNDFFKRIPTGFGNCTLRRVESHREGKPKHPSTSAAVTLAMKERVKCGGIFRGFIMTSSSSSSSSSSYWVSSSAKEMNRRAMASPLVHGRSKS